MQCYVMRCEAGTSCAASLDCVLGWVGQSEAGSVARSWRGVGEGMVRW